VNGEKSDRPSAFSSQHATFDHIKKLLPAVDLTDIAQLVGIGGQGPETGALYLKYAPRP
jgi:hypothetical protein